MPLTDSELHETGITRLKEIAKEEGVTGYSKYRSGDKHLLIDLIIRKRRAAGARIQPASPRSPGARRIQPAFPIPPRSPGARRIQPAFPIPLSPPRSPGARRISSGGFKSLRKPCMSYTIAELKQMASDNNLQIDGRMTKKAICEAYNNKLSEVTLPEAVQPPLASPRKSPVRRPAPAREIFTPRQKPVLDKKCMSYLKPQLKEIAKANGLALTGTKEELCSRILTLFDEPGVSNETPRYPRPLSPPPRPLSPPPRPLPPPPRPLPPPPRPLPPPRIPSEKLPSVRQLYERPRSTIPPSIRPPSNTLPDWSHEDQAFVPPRIPSEKLPSVRQLSERPRSTIPPSIRPPSNALPDWSHEDQSFVPPRIPSVRQLSERGRSAIPPSIRPPSNALPDWSCPSCFSKNPEDEHACRSCRSSREDQAFVSDIIRTREEIIEASEESLAELDDKINRTPSREARLLLEDEKDIIRDVTSSIVENIDSLRVPSKPQSEGSLLSSGRSSLPRGEYVGVSSPPPGEPEYLHIDPDYLSHEPNPESERTSLPRGEYVDVRSPPPLEEPEYLRVDPDYRLYKPNPEFESESESEESEEEGEGVVEGGIEGEGGVEGGVEYVDVRSPPPLEEPEYLRVDPDYRSYKPESESESEEWDEVEVEGAGGEYVDARSRPLEEPEYLSTDPDYRSYKPESEVEVESEVAGGEYVDARSRPLEEPEYLSIDPDYRSYKPESEVEVESEVEGGEYVDARSRPLEEPEYLSVDSDYLSYKPNPEFESESESEEGEVGEYVDARSRPLEEPEYLSIDPDYLSYKPNPEFESEVEGGEMVVPSIRPEGSLSLHLSEETDDEETIVPGDIIIPPVQRPPTSVPIPSKRKVTWAEQVEESRTTEEEIALIRSRTPQVIGRIPNLATATLEEINRILDEIAAPATASEGDLRNSIFQSLGLVKLV